MGRKWDDLITEEPSRAHRDTVRELARVELDRNVDLTLEKPHEERRGWLLALLGAATMAGVAAVVSRLVMRSAHQTNLIDPRLRSSEWDAALHPSAIGAAEELASLGELEELELFENLDLLDELEGMGAYRDGTWQEPDLELQNTENV